MAKLKDTPNDDVKPQIIEKEVEKFIKLSESNLDIFNELLKQHNNNFMQYVNDFFKHYLTLGFKELNTILLSNNCIELLSEDISGLLRVYLLAFKVAARKFNKFNQTDNIRLLTRNLRQIYQYNEFVIQNVTPIFETQDKKYFLGGSHKLYTIQKENK